MAADKKPLRTSKRLQEAQIHILRYYDAFDGWVDCGGPDTPEAIHDKYLERTENETKACWKAKAPMGEYYDIFPADTVMMQRPETMERNYERNK